MKKKIFVIACAVLAVDMKHSATELGLDVEYMFLEAGLHSNPKLLNKKLQTAINEITATGICDRIIIGYGVCGYGTIGIQSGNVPLILPKVHDCIALFLGGDAAYKSEFKKYPGTYYFSAGWCEEKTEPMSQRSQITYFGDQKLKYSDVVNKYGEKAANQTFKFLNSWQKNYQRAVFIETGAKVAPHYVDLAKKTAEEFHWRFDKIQGSQSLIKKILTLDQSTPEILYVPPDHVIAFDAIHATLSANPILQSHQKIDANLIEIRNGNKAIETGTYIKIGLGIDAGGTYTDAVIYDLLNNRTLGKSKSLTTKWDFTVGISKALAKLDPKQIRQVELVALSTTLATNAIVENEGQQVGMILMPPNGLGEDAGIYYQPKFVIRGQLDISGNERVAIDPEEIKQVAQKMVDTQSVTAFAVSGFAASINPSHEIEVKKIIQDQTGLFVSCGHELSDNLNFKVRATTAMLNARIIPRLTNLLLDLEKVMAVFGIDSPVVVVKGDGTLMSSTIAKQRPVETVLSGPAASVAGAKHLTGIKDALVVDMGGTTTDTAALSNNQVSLNNKGSNIGGHRTHVQALDIRTTGLGGDSLIQFEKGTFTIGPNRVVPLACLGRNSSGTDRAIEYLSNHIQKFFVSTRRMQIIALTGSAKIIELKPLEKKIITLLSERPYSIDELVERTDVYTDSSLPLRRLEEHFIIQRCGLTPTDLLHITGDFEIWETQTARKIADLYTFLTKTSLPQLVDLLLNKAVDLLTLELFKHQLDKEVDPKALDSCPVCKTLMHNLLGNNQSDFGVSISLKHPVIGIGAPIKYFLGKAAKHLNAVCILPEDGDVANAIGAITSHVVIKKQMRIVPGGEGGFRVEGISGQHQFKDFYAADRFVRDSLTTILRENALRAGTSCQTVMLETLDQIPTTATGSAIFVARSINATLTGRPDLILKKDG